MKNQINDKEKESDIALNDAADNSESAIYNGFYINQHHTEMTGKIATVKIGINEKGVEYISGFLSQLRKTSSKSYLKIARLVKFVCYKKEYFDLLISASGIDVNQQIEIGREYQGINKISERPKVTMIGNKTSIGKEDNVDTVWIERVIDYDFYVAFCKKRDELFDCFDPVKGKSE
jgi:hypothetical protein